MEPAAPTLQGLEQHRGYLLRYALLQLRDRDAAEDAVQETLLAALQGQAGYAGKSSPRTWLTGILKHKLVDLVRRRAREQPLTLDDETSEADAVDALFQEDGHWQRFPADWGDPLQALENRDFRAVFEMCTQVMPVRTARVFMMREVMELSTDDICATLAITPNHLWVLLHRARLLLRECIAIRWGKA